MVGDHVSFAELALWGEGAGSPGTATHVELCVVCAGRAVEVGRRLESLAVLPPRLAGHDFAAALARQVGSRPRVRRTLAAAAGLGLAGLIAVWLVPWTAPPELRAKGGSEADVTGVTLYRVEPDGRAVLTAGELGRRDAVVVTYSNDGPHVWRYLMVFAVDAAGAVHWYHPEYAAATDDPESIAIEPAARGRLLPEQIRHDLPPGPLVVWALFSDAPWRVRDVEARIHGGTWSGPLTGAALHHEALEVGP